MMWGRGSPSERKPSRKPEPSDGPYQPLDIARLSSRSAAGAQAAGSAEWQLQAIASWAARLGQDLGGGERSTGIPALDAAGQELMLASARAMNALGFLQAFLHGQGR